MGYRVDYQSDMKFCQRRRSRSRAAGLTGVFFLLFLLLVNGIWPRGKEVLRGVLFSGDAAVTAAALEDMACDLRTGIPFSDALKEFCFQIIEESGFAEG